MLAERRFRTGALVLSVLVAAAAALAGCTSGGGSSSKSSAANSSSVKSAASNAAPAATTPTGTAAAAGLQAAFTDVVQRTLPSVVEITTSSGLGSGVILDTQGDVVTNDHVVGTATTFKVGLANTATTYAGKLVGTFPPDDLAVIRIQGAKNLQPATLGDSTKLRAGDLVMAVGNPLGLASSVTEGIVSALGRTVNEPQGSDSPGATIPDTIQTSAPINPGNSGGALVNLAGQVVGVPTLAAVDQQIGSGSAAPGIGFAIAANMVRSIADQLIAHGKVTNSGRAALGVSVETVSDASGNPVGAGVVSVVPGGPAAKAGIKPGDIITKVGSTAVTSSQGLADALVHDAAGQRVSVTLTSVTGGGTHAVNVVLGELAGG